MQPAYFISQADHLLPAKFGLLLVFSGFGILGGVAAGLTRFAAPFPSLLELFSRAIVGGAVGSLGGAACLARLGTDDTAIWWSICVCGGAGFAGPTALVPVFKRVITALFSKPGDPP